MWNTGPAGYSFQLCDDVIYTPRGRTGLVVTVIVLWTCVSYIKCKVTTLHACVICLISQMFSSESSHWHIVDNEHFSLCCRWRESFRNLSFFLRNAKLLWKRSVLSLDIIAHTQPNLTSPFITLQPKNYKSYKKYRPKSFFYVCEPARTAWLFT